MEDRYDADFKKAFVLFRGFALMSDLSDKYHDSAIKTAQFLGMDEKPHIAIKLGAKWEEEYHYSDKWCAETVMRAFVVIVQRHFMANKLKTIDEVLRSVSLRLHLERPYTQEQYYELEARFGLSPKLPTTEAESYLLAASNDELLDVLRYYEDAAKFARELYELRTTKYSPSKLESIRAAEQFYEQHLGMGVKYRLRLEEFERQHTPQRKNKRKKREPVLDAGISTLTEMEH